MKTPTIVIHSDPEDVVAAVLGDVQGVSVIHLDELTRSWCVREAEVIEPVLGTVDSEPVLCLHHQQGLRALSHGDWLASSSIWSA